MESRESRATVVDGSQIRHLVENKDAFHRYVDEKFVELDKDKSGKLNVQELQPAVSKIGIALGLPSRGSSPDSDHIYEEVTKEFLHGRESINKEEFSSVLADILLGMADGLERDPIFLQNINGEELQRYANSAEFEVDALAIYSEPDEEDKSIQSLIIQALGNISVENGMPPTSDQSVMKNKVEPAVESLSTCINLHAPRGDLDQVAFVEVFRKAVEHAAWQLKVTPVTVARSEKTYDGKSVARLLRQKSELEKVLHMTWKSLPRDRHGSLSREYLRVGLDILAPDVGLPPLGIVEE
ncbi:hypothetical protein KI387_022659, partial [Taxus chinensis]